MYILFLILIAIVVAIYLIVMYNKKQEAIPTDSPNENAEKKPFDKKWILVLIAVIAIVAVVYFAINANKTVDFQKDFAEYQYKYWCDIADDNSYLQVDTNPSDIEDFYNTDAADAIQEINKELGFTSALYQKMLDTCALDGRQYDENDKVKVSWTYHPDKGLVVTYERKD